MSAGQFRSLALAHLVEFDRLQEENAALKSKVRRFRVKFGPEYGEDLAGHKFWIVPVDNFAEEALLKRIKG